MHSCGSSERSSASSLVNVRGRRRASRRCAACSAAKSISWWPPKWRRICENPERSRRVKRLRRLHLGDRIALVAPASSFPHEELSAGVAELKRLGFEPVYDDTILEKDRFVAGSVRTRVEAIMRAWQDDSIAALIAMRGGYGSAQLLPFLDPHVLVDGRKALIGYSD